MVQERECVQTAEEADAIHPRIKESKKTFLQAPVPDMGWEEAQGEDEVWEEDEGVIKLLLFIFPNRMSARDSPFLLH